MGAEEVTVRGDDGLEVGAVARGGFGGMVSEDGHGELSRTEDGDDAGHEFVEGGQVFDVGLEGDVGVGRLGGDVDGVVIPIGGDGVEGEAAGVEEELVGLGARQQLVKAQVLGELFGAQGGLGLVEQSHDLGVEFGHHDLQRLLVLVVGVGVGEIGHVKVPMLTGGGAQNVGVASVLKELLQGGHLGVERDVGEQLLAGKHKVLATVGDEAHSEALFGRVFQHFVDAFEQGGGTAGLQNDLERVHEERRLTENIRVKIFIFDRRDDLASGHVKHCRPLFSLDVQKSFRIFTRNNEVDNQLLFRSFKKKNIFSHFFSKRCGVEEMKNERRGVFFFSRNKKKVVGVFFSFEKKLRMLFVFPSESKIKNRLFLMIKFFFQMKIDSNGKKN